MQRRPVRCLKLTDLLNNVAVNTLRFFPVKTVEAARDDVFRRLVERLGDRVVALVRPVGGEDLVGPAPQKHVELTGDSLANGLVQAIVQERHGPASVGEPVPRILLGATGRLHDAVESDLRDCDDLSHGFSREGCADSSPRMTRLEMPYAPDSQLRASSRNASSAGVPATTMESGIGRPFFTWRNRMKAKPASCPVRDTSE